MEGVRRGSNTQIYSTAVKTPISSYKLQHLFPTKSSNIVLNKLDPVTRVNGIPGWYWIRGIKCSDTTRVGLVY